MKLYYSPGACSLSPHIILREAGVTFDLERVDLKTRTTEKGADFSKINPKGYIPALQLDSGEILTEGAVIVQYIADQNPKANLAPANGTMARTRMQEYLNFIAAELHKAFSPLFNPTSTDDAKKAAVANVSRRLDYVETLFADGRSYLLGDTLTGADTYLFTVAGWTAPTGIGLAKWPHIAAFVARVAARPAAQAAMRAEGLI